MLSLLDLPDGVLCNLLTALDARDRLRLESSCARLRELGAAWGPEEACYALPEDMDSSLFDDSVARRRAAVVAAFLAWAATRPAVTALEVRVFDQPLRPVHPAVCFAHLPLSFEDLTSPGYHTQPPPTYCGALEPLTRLTSLRVHVAGGERDSVESLASCSALVALTLVLRTGRQGVNMFTERLAFVASLPRLAAFCLGPPHATILEDTSPLLWRLSHLHALNWPHAPRCFGELLGFSALESLSLNAVFSTYGQSVLFKRHAARLAQLTSLTLSYCRLGFGAFKSMPELRELRLQECTVTMEEAARCMRLVGRVTLLEVGAPESWPRPFRQRPVASPWHNGESEGVPYYVESAADVRRHKAERLPTWVFLDSLYVLGSVRKYATANLLHGLVELGLEEADPARLQEAVQLALRQCPCLRHLRLGLFQHRVRDRARDYRERDLTRGVHPFLGQHPGALGRLLGTLCAGLEGARYLRSMGLSATGVVAPLLLGEEEAGVLQRAFAQLLDARVSVHLWPPEILSEVQLVLHRAVAVHRTHELLDELVVASAA